jgi:hypothetical protein
VAEARMTPGVVDSLGGEDLGDIGPAPSEARLIYSAEYGDPSSELERHLFIACSASLPKLPKPPQLAKPPRKPSIRTLVKRAEQATGKAVTAITLPDGTKLELASAPDPATESNPWRADLKVMKK